MEDPASEIGEPTKLWAVEAVWITEQEGDPPTLGNVARAIEEMWDVSTDEAIGRVLDAVRLAEVEAVLTDEGEWRLRIDRRVAARVERRHRFWSTVRALAEPDEWQTESFSAEVLDAAWRRIEETA
jgi:hypothetical protein